MVIEVQFNAAVAGVRTLRDGGRQVILDLPEDAGEAFAILAECQRFGEYLHVTAVGTGRSARRRNKKGKGGLGNVGFDDLLDDMPAGGGAG